MTFYSYHEPVRCLNSDGEEYVGHLTSVISGEDAISHERALMIDNGFSIVELEDQKLLEDFISNNWATEVDSKFAKEVMSCDLETSEKWHNRFLEIAYLVRDWSKDPSTKVGAVIVRDKRILATGYNGIPSLIKDDNRILEREWKLSATVHAEVNAIFNAAKNGASLSNSTLYSTMFPCSHCSSAIIQSGIKQIYLKEESRSEYWPKRWQENFKLSQELLSEANVSTLFI